MKKRIENSLKGIMLVVPALLLAACVEHSTVVKVNKDGSGIIHERTYMNSGMMGGMLGGLGGASTPGEPGDGEITVNTSPGADLPAEEDLRERAKELGEGVTLKSVTPGKNKAGWDGYEVIFEFADINKVRVDANMDAAMQEGVGEPDDTAGAGEEKEPQWVTFEMADGVLQIHTPDLSMSGVTEAGSGFPGGPGAPDGAGDPFEAAGAGPPGGGEAGMAMMMAGMMQGMRVGMFVYAATPIAKTNAKHQNGNMVTLMMMEMGKVLQNPAGMQKLEGLEKETDRTKAQEVIDSIDGITADLQSPITIEFQ